MLRRSRWISLIVLSAIVGGPAVAPGETPLHSVDVSGYKHDELAGTWRLISEDGEELDAGENPGNALSIKFDPANKTWNAWTDEATQAGSDAESSEWGAYDVDRKSYPKKLTLTLADGDQETKLLAIYRIVGDRLTVQVRHDEKRPTQFDASDDDGITLVLKRSERSR